MPANNPDAIRKFLNDELDATLRFYKNTLQKLETPDDESRLASQTYMSAATAWECFLSDIVIAYIEIDPEVFFEHLKRSHEDGRTRKQKLIQEKYTKINFPESINSEEIIEFIDSEKRNITFSSASDLNKKVKNWISEDYFKKFNEITKEETAIINLIISLRNFIAHQSKGSFAKLERCARVSQLKSLGLFRKSAGMPDYGNYLNGIHDEKTRFEIIATQMKKIGGKF